MVIKKNVFPFHIISILTKKLNIWLQRNTLFPFRETSILTKKLNIIMVLKKNIPSNMQSGEETEHMFIKKNTPSNTQSGEETEHMVIKKNTPLNMQSGEETEHMVIKKNNGTVVPLDGGWGWMIVFGSFMVHLITDGILYAFGILYIELLDYYKGGKGETAWIGSLAIGFQLFAGPLASILTNKFGCRFTTIIGAVVSALGFVMSIFSPNLYFLYFSFGTISGIGFCLTYLPAIVSVGHYFEKKRTFAVGIATCGSGIGSFIFNPLTKYLIDSYAWRGALLIQAGILLNCVLCGAIFRPLGKQRSFSPDANALKTHMEDGEENLHDVKTPANHSDCAHTDQSLLEPTLTSEFENVKSYVCKHEMSSLLRENSLQKTEGSQEKRRPADDTTDKTCRHEELQLNETDSNTPSFLPKSERKIESFELMADKKTTFSKKLCCGFRQPSFYHTMKNSCNFSPLNNAVFVLYLISNVLASLSLNVPFVFLYDRAIVQGIDEESAKWLGAIIGIVNTFGRILSGLLADKFKINRLLLFNSSLTICGIATIFCPLCHNFTSLVLFSCVFGLSFGIYIPLMSVVLVDLLGLDMLNNSFGLLLMFKGMANLIGPPAAGWLYDVTGSYDISFIISGVIFTASGLLMFPVTCVRRCRKNKKCESRDPSDKSPTQ